MVTFGEIYWEKGLETLLHPTLPDLGGSGSQTSRYSNDPEVPVVPHVELVSSVRSRDLFSKALV